MKFENITVTGIENAVIGARLPMCKDLEEAKAKSDSVNCNELSCSLCSLEYKCNKSKSNKTIIGKEDMELLKDKLIAADDGAGAYGQPNSKFLRMIHFQCAITAPVYFMAELDTYKIATTRNSTSMQHKGVSHPYTIDNFEVDEKIKEVLRIKEKDFDKLCYPYETTEYKMYTCENGRKYKVYKNGKLFSCEYDLTDETGRTRHFEEREIIPSLTRNGYYECNIGGRNGEKWMIHRLVATVWLNNKNNYETVDHLNCNKGDNSVENLEWVSREENIKREWDNFKGFDLQKNYKNWKYSSKVNPVERLKIKELWKNGVPQKEIASMFEIKQGQVSAICNNTDSTSENKELFEQCWYWEQMLDTLNELRDKYLDTNDYKYFRLIRQLMPMGYNYTSMFDCDYQTLRNIYHWRRNHKLTEWHKFCDMVKDLPYADEFITGE